jgi:hypothetical protein
MKSGAGANKRPTELTACGTEKKEAHTGKGCAKTISKSTARMNVNRRERVTGGIATREMHIFVSEMQNGGRKD